MSTILINHYRQFRKTALCYSSPSKIQTRERRVTKFIVVALSTNCCDRSREPCRFETSLMKTARNSMPPLVAMRSHSILLVLLSIFSLFTQISSLLGPGILHPSSTLKSTRIDSRYHTDNLMRETSYLRKTLLHNAGSDELTTINDSVFGAEFKESDAINPQEEKTYWRGNIQYTEISPEKRGKVMKGYDNLRITFLLDNLFISALGLCLLWSFGTYKDAFSYGVGSLLGTGYAALLARYVESLGSKQGGGAGGGAARFAPVVLLILLYSKNKEFISIVPEILGFFTFQVASLLQIFNEDAYGESEEK